MRSHLTHRLFHKLTDSALYTDVHGICFLVSHRCVRPQRPPPTHQRCPQLHYPRRHLFGFARGQKRQPKPANYEPGYEVLQTLNERLKMGVRPPSVGEIADALKRYIRYKITPENRATRLEEIQAELLKTAYIHLKNQAGERHLEHGLPGEDIRRLLNLLSTMPPKDFTSGSHIPLSEAVFEDIKAKNEEAKAQDVPEPQGIAFGEVILSHVKVLAYYGKALEARGLVYDYWKPYLKNLKRSAWIPLVQGLLREGKEQEVEALLQDLQKRGILVDAMLHQEIMSYYTRQKPDIERAKRWYELPIAEGGRPSLFTFQNVLQLCMRRRDFIWGDTILKTMLESHPDVKSTWDYALQWAAAKGRGVDEIERMMEVNVRRNHDRPHLHPSIRTINDLAMLANENDNPYAAERYIELGKKWGMEPDAFTYVVQLDYRIKVKDLAGAMVTYSSLRGQDFSDVDMPSFINRLIVAFCKERRENFDTIMSLVDDLIQVKGEFLPSTVAALSDLHLQRGEMHDLQDLLNTHTFSFGLPNRELVRQTLLDHILDSKTTEIRAWEIYNILHTVFYETPVSVRIEIMNSFFARYRPDMATRVFGHMRQAQIKEQRPAVSTYTACLTGIARLGDSESLQTVHNMSKLDNEIVLDTQLRNALMLAYAGCDDPRRALEFWNDIVHSREGPTYSSIQIALMACEKAPFGDIEAQKIWNRLKDDDIEVTREIYAAYVGALAGRGLFDRCVDLCKGAEAEGLEVDALL